MNDPDEILHIALPDDWAAAKNGPEYRVSSRGKTFDEEGFVHCSYVRQLESVANRFYADKMELLLLHLDPDLLEAEIKVEPSTENADELFPHVYGPIPIVAVVATTWWDRGEDGMWRRPTII
jgi:uncharacterized protein (DUF952 family)